MSAGAVVVGAGEGDCPAEALLRLIELTGEMLAAAESGEWDTLARLEQQQRDIAEKTFARPVPAREAKAFAERLEFLLNLNGEVAAVISEQRRRNAEQLLAIQAGRRAKQAYSE